MKGRAGRAEPRLSVPVPTPRHRALGRRRPRHPGVPLRGVRPRTRSAASARTVLKFHPRLAPIKAAVFPLVRKDGMPEKAQEIYKEPEGRRPQRLLRREGRDRPPLPPPGRGRHAVLHHRRRPDPPGRHRHLPRPRLATPVAGARRRRPSGAAGPARRGAGAGCGLRATWSVGSWFAVVASPEIGGSSSSSLPPIRPHPWQPRRFRRSSRLRSVHLAPTPDAHDSLYQSSHDAEHSVRGGPAGLRTGRLDGVELWLTKLEAFLESHGLDEARTRLNDHGLRPLGASMQGGLLLSRGSERQAHWDHFRCRL